jgi:hypothetical protein
MTDATATASLTPGPTAAPAAPPPAPAAAPASQTLDELMMAMDVVDTLRHQEKIVQAEMGQSVRDDELKARLRDLYQSQGLAVTDAILDQGIRALKESRFTYQPPPPSWSLSLAKLWVRRTIVGTMSAGALAALGLGWGTYYFGFVAPERAQVERSKIEISEILPRELEDIYVGVVNLAQTDEGRRQAGALLADGRFALGRKDINGVRNAQAQLEALRGQLLLEYSLRIVASTPSAVWRIPPDNARGRNYYVLVQAIGTDGKPIAMDITSEENNERRNVAVWGVRVSEAKYNKVRRDKQDNGIIEDNIVARKQRGYLDPEFVPDARAAFITEWAE